MHWLVIIIGIIIISVSISNPLYRLVIKKRIKLNLFFEVLFRILLFLLSVIIIFIGLYLESIN